MKLWTQILIFMALSVPVVVGAQTYKCKTSGGEIIYQDSECSAETTHENINPTLKKVGGASSSDSLQRKRFAYMPDASCVQENQKAGKYCGEISVAITKQCMRERLSPDCVKKYESAPMAIQTADEACRKEIQAAAMPCVQTQIATGKQCVQEQLSLKCREKTNRFLTEFEKSRKQCERTIRQACAGKNGALFFECMEKHQAELKAACDDL